MIRELDENVMVGSQIDPHQVAELAQQGVTVLVNNRPDGEEPGQPSAVEIEDAAAAAGIIYHFIPIIRGIGPADVEFMRQALHEAEGGKLFAFCRSGQRSAFALAVARRAGGVPAQEVKQSLVQAGFDPGPISHLL